VRAQLVQRLQVGLFGLSLMLLLVGLANIIMDQARRNDAAMAQSAQATATTSGNTTDPLADIAWCPRPMRRSTAARPATRRRPLTAHRPALACLCGKERELLADCAETSRKTREALRFPARIRGNGA
jgi:hypothetical protein